MKYPTKKVRYSGTIQAHTGDFLVYMEDGSVKTFREAVAGAVTSNNKGSQEEIEFYTPDCAMPKEVGNNGQNNKEG